MLDFGTSRVSGPYVKPYDEPGDGHEVHLAQNNTHEVFDKDLTPDERQEVSKGKRKEWDKLLNTESIRIHTGVEAKKLRDEQPKERFLGSRFVKTRREDPNQPGKTEIKCKWCVKGFRDPDIYEMNRQLPTLSMEALMVTLQILASNQWLLHIADVEGAFLQGETLKRKNGRVFVEVAKEDCTVLGITEGAVVELVKCVYGLSDAPRAWWESFSKTAQSLGLKQSELDLCVFLWFHENSLQGILSLHVDDMVLGGS